MKEGLYVTTDPEYPFFKVRDKAALWVGYHEVDSNPRYHISQTEGYWELSDDHGEERCKTHVAPLLMTEWQK